MWKKRAKRMVLSFLTIGLLSYIGLGMALYIMQPRMVYVPITLLETNPGEEGVEYQDVYFDAADGTRLNGWYVPVENSPKVVLFCHGNGGNISYYIDTAAIFRQLGMSCFVFDYRGYGMSQGRPSEQGTYDDASGAYNWLVKNKGFKPADVIIFGRSLGGAIAAELGSRVKNGGVVLESTFSSCADVGSHYYPYLPVKLFCRYGYRTVDYVKKVKSPVLSIHSRQDDIIPYELGKKVFAAANEPKSFVEIKGSHNEGFYESGMVYISALDDWFKSL